MLLLCSRSPNGVTPERQQNVSIAVVPGTMHPSKGLLFTCPWVLKPACSNFRILIVVGYDVPNFDGGYFIIMDYIPLLVFCQNFYIEKCSVIA